MPLSIAPLTFPRAAYPFTLIVVTSLLLAAIVPAGMTRALDEPDAGHLLISEVVTGGASASDELIEIYNPGPNALPLEGLEVIYVSASGATISRRAAWAVGAPEVPPGHHVLVANELGAYASIADALYASGMAATGGSVALRTQGSTTAIDAVGWGTAASTWVEGMPATAPAAGSSIERLPGGAVGSTQDTDLNAADFVERSTPDPQNASSPPTPDPSQPPPTPTPMPTVAPTPTSTPTPAATPVPTATPTVATIPIGSARSLPEGTVVTVEGTALTDSTFTEGGGYVADDSAGIAVLLASGAFERGARLRVSGTLDDRFAQRTIRAGASDVVSLGTGVEPEPIVRATGAVDESVEGGLVRLGGTIAGSPTGLAAGLAFDVNDGSGVARVIVAPSTGIDTGPWAPGTFVDVVGVVGQRDSTGSGVSGYRVQPRDSADVRQVGGTAPSASPGPGGSAPPHPSGSPVPTPDTDGVVSIADARAAPKNARVRIRGVVTLPPGVVDAGTAAIQDDSGAILLRLGGEVGPLVRGERVEVDGTRSTLAGMETLRITQPARRLGNGPEPGARPLKTGDASEPHEAMLVVSRGALVSSARRASTGTVSFELDDGSGPLRVYVGASLGADHSALRAGTWVEVRGVLGQETTGALPLRGYRIWPREAAEVRVLADATAAAASSTSGASAGGAGGAAGETGGPAAALDEIGSPDLAELRIGATLVSGRWPELEVGGLLWDGERLVGIAPASEAVLDRALETRRVPIAIEMTGLRSIGVGESGIAMVALSSEPGAVVPGRGPVAPPRGEVPAAGDGPWWVALVGRLASESEPRLQLGDARPLLALRCRSAEAWPSGTVSVRGIALAEPPRILVPCGGVRAVPALDRSPASLAPSVITAASGTRTRASAAGEPLTRPLAAGLLAIGALILVVAAALRRWLDRDEAPSPPEASEAPGPVAGASPPGLTLVRVPHERRSP